MVDGVDPNAPAPAGGDWRAHLQPEARTRIVNKIMETLKKHLPVSVPEELNELQKVAVRFEEKIYTAAINQSDYLRKLSLKMLSMETKSQQPPGNAQVIPNQNPSGPAYGMGKQNEVVKSEEGVSRDKYITWSDETTKFMLEWYIDIHKDKPPTFKWKKQHHLQCAEALNGRFGIGATRNQVDWHFRSCKEKWNWIRTALGKSGFGFDAPACKFNIDLSEKDPKKMGTTKYNYLTRPIKFFHLLEELFVDFAQADGSLALDQSTVNVASDSGGSESVKELETYSLIVEDGGKDSVTIARDSPTTEGTNSSKKRKRIKSPATKQSKDKGSHGKASNDEMAASIVRLADSLVCANPAASVQQNAQSDPNANLWKRIENLTITAKDKIDIATFLAKPEQEYFRGYLSIASDVTFQVWVIDYFERKYSGGGDFGSM